METNKDKRLPLAKDDNGDWPHSSPAECPTWYDWCHCTVETLNSLIEERDRIIKFLDEVDPSYKGCDIVTRMIEICKHAITWGACTGCGKVAPCVRRLHGSLCEQCHTTLRKELDYSKANRTGPRFFAVYAKRNLTWLERYFGPKPYFNTIGCGLYISQTPAQAMAEAKRLASREGWTLIRLDIQKTLTDIYRHPDYRYYFHSSKNEPLEYDTEKYGEIPA